MIQKKTAQTNGSHPARSRNNTERKRAEEALRESEERYRTLFERTNNPILAIDTEGNYIACNDAALRFLECTRDEVLAKNILDFVPSGKDKQVLREHGPLWEHGGTVETEYYVNGRVKILELTITPTMWQGKQVVLGVGKDITQRKQAEEALRRSEATYREIFNAANDGILVLDIETGEIVDANATFRNVLGYTAEEAQGLQVGDFSSSQPAYAQENALRLIHNAARGQPQRFEWLAKSGDGKLLWIDVTLKRATIAGQDRVLAIGRDITERKQAEEALRASEETYRSIFNATNDSIVVHDMETGEIVDANAAFQDRHGCTTEEARQLNVVPLGSGEAPYTQEDALRWILKAARGEPQRFEWLSKDREGRHIWLDITLKRATIAGHDRVLAIGRDITERKRAEEALRRSEESLHSVVTNAPVILFALDREGVFTLAEGKGLSALGVKPDEHIGLSVFDLYRDVPEIIEAAQRALAGEAFTTTARVEELIFEAHVAPVRDHDGRITGAIAVATDVTARMRAEEALRETSQTLQALIQASPLAITTSDLEGNIRTWNPTAERTFGWSELEALGRPNPIIPEDRQNEFRANLDAVLQGNLLSQVETRRRKKDGSLIDVSLSTAAMRSATGEIIGAMGILADITERKRMEEALRESEERFRAIVENAPFGYYRVGKDGLWQYVNPVWERMHGYSLKDVIGKPFEITQTREDVEKARQNVKQALAGETITGEFSRTTRLGTIEYHSFNIQPVRQGNEIVAIEGFINDITERKRAEEALRESEERYRLLAENVTDVIWTADMDLNFTYISPSRRLLGQAPGQPMPQRVEEALTPASFEIAMKAFAEELATENMDEKDLSRSRTLELENYRSDGSTIWVEDRMTFLRDPDGRPVGILGVTRDITERKQAEEALRETTQTLQALIQASPLAILTMDLQGNVRTWNSAAERIFGWSEQEAVGRPNPIIPEDRQNEFRALLDAVVQGNLLSQVETRRRRKDGSLIDVSLSTAAMRDATGDVIGAMAIIADITVRKRMEEALQKAREELEARVERQMEQGNPYGLTFRELTVLHQVAAGKADKEIGLELGISPLTASKHLTNILSKMGAASRTEAGVRALREGLLD